MGALLHAEKSTPVPWEKHGGSIGHLVKLAYIAMRRELDASIREEGITPTQWQALGVLCHMPGLTHSELMKHLAIEPPSVTSLVNGMQRKGLIRSERSSADARAKRLFLTAAGRHLIDRLRRATEPIERRMAAALSDAERETLRTLLRTLVDSLSQPATPAQSSRAEIP